MRHALRYLAALHLTLAIATAPAWAVVVSFEATDQTGEPLPGATIRIGEEEAVTGEDGTVALDVAAEPGEEIVVVVVHRGEVVFDRAVIVRAGEAVELPTSAPGQPMFDPDAPIFTDGFESGDTALWTRSAVTARVSTERVEPELSSQRFEVVTRVDGVVVPEQSQSGTLSPTEIEQARSTERKRHEVPTNFGVKLEIPLPRLGRGGGLLRTAGPGGLLAAADDTGLADSVASPSAGGRSSGGGGWRFYPSLSLAAGQADVEFQSIVLADDSRTTFEGDGPVFGAGLRGVLFPCADCRWFLEMGYEHARTDDIEMTRSPGLDASLPPGIMAARDRVEYRARSNSLSLTVGRAARHVAGWVGARSVRWRGNLDIDLLLQADGLPAEQSQSARNEFEEDLVEAVVGTDVRFPGSRFVLRLEGSSDGDNYSLAFGLGAAFGR